MLGERARLGVEPDGAPGGFGIGDTFAVPVPLKRPRRRDARSNRNRGLARRRTHQFRWAGRVDLDHQVDPIHQRPADLAPIIFSAARRPPARTRVPDRIDSRTGTGSSPQRAGTAPDR
jgi:hypothetical protein